MEDKCENTRFLERSNRGLQMFFGVLSIMPCATAVNDFLGCPVCDLWCLMFDQMFDHVDTLLSSIDFQCYDHFVSYVATTFVSHNVL